MIVVIIVVVDVFASSWRTGHLQISDVVFSSGSLVVVFWLAGNFLLYF